MKQAIKRLWIDALRSGEYEQGHRVLVLATAGVDRKYCCLGVLCQLAVNNRVPIDVTVEYSTVVGDDVLAYDGVRFNLPESVIEWAGLGSDNPSVSTMDGSGTTLADMNDNGASFNQIALEIEEHL